MPERPAAKISAQGNQSRHVSQADQRADEKYVQKRSQYSKGPSWNLAFSPTATTHRQRVIQRRLRCLVVDDIVHAAVLAAQVGGPSMGCCHAAGELSIRQIGGIPTNSGEPYNTRKASPRGYRLQRARAVALRILHHQAKWICSSTL